jgi:hypothetical protein
LTAAASTQTFGGLTEDALLMTKIDLKKNLKHLYKPSAKEVKAVDVPNMNFLMIDGWGNPNTSQQYAEAIEALYSLAYALKFRIKKGQSGIDYGVMPLEGLWWGDDESQFNANNKEAWNWTVMIMQPEYVTAKLVAEAKSEVERKKKLAALAKVRFASYREGSAAQIIHVGPYADEGPTIAKLHEFITRRGSKACGKHHEIYLGDPRKTAPAKLQTVIRQPFK